MSIHTSLLHSFAIPRKLIHALRSDHAGETGAVAIYEGILAVTQDAELQRFARAHVASERRHLELIEQVVAPEMRSRLLPLWRVAGYATGALPALFGAAAVYRTVEAVETFVDEHYTAQIEYLRDCYPDARLLQLLEACRADEVAHRDEASARLGNPRLPGRVWSALIDAGSRAGVFLASRI